ncbi:MAG: prepilin-type N-terminal cleavage/methylation domain-containing protein [Tumebacillaceae bacterium]
MKRRDERGVTLLELILAVAILVMVTSAAIAFIHSVYDSYSRTSSRSLNQQQATTLLNRLAQDIRDAQPVDDAIQVDEQNGSDQVTIHKRPDPAVDPVTVSYAKQEDGSIVYLRNADNPQEQIVLADSGTLMVAVRDGVYQLSIAVGEGADRITLHTSVARYEWGN